MPIKLEYYQSSTDGNPSVALLWSLLPPKSSDSFEEIAGADADAVVLVVVGGANNDQKGTTEGEGVDRASLTLAGEQMAPTPRNYSIETMVNISGAPTTVPGGPNRERRRWSTARTTRRRRTRSR